MAEPHPRDHDEAVVELVDVPLVETPHVERTPRALLQCLRRAVAVPVQRQRYSEQHQQRQYNAAQRKDDFGGGHTADHPERLRVPGGTVARSLRDCAVSVATLRPVLGDPACRLRGGMGRLCSDARARRKEVAQDVVAAAHPCRHEQRGAREDCQQGEHDKRHHHCTT